MRIRLFHTLPSEGRTSSEVYARELGRAIEQVGTNGTTMDHWQPTSRVRDVLGSAAVPTRVAGYVDRYICYQWSVRGRDADVNHVVDHGYGHLGFSLDPRRTVMSFHDAMLLKLEARELPTDLYPRFTILGHKLSLRAITRAARVIADSESSRRDFLRFTRYHPSQVRTVPLGVAELFQPPADGTARPTGRLPRILHVGHCEPYKNIESILQAVPRIAQRLGTPVQFVKIGGPFTAAQQQLIARLGIHQHVQHRGAVPLPELPRAYADADVLLMPSLYEGFGLPALEAMACGTPVVVSKQGSLPEVVGDAGLLVESMDLEGIAEAVASVIADPRLSADLRYRGIERAREFTWERTARETLAVYREVYEESR